ncbi:MAG: polysaccharide biosynthesis C-terminal domain-containing protein, partial [Clostridia bacterium]|nr:polysaccharide biosynthesis C-terminal domain-containing protein [Clostridia bacterium]
MEQKDRRIKYNLISGVVYQVVLIALSFLLPRLYLENFGSEVNGVLSTIKQIFTYMCLLEAGVGLATTQALYKPVAQKDFGSASAVLSATNKYYIKTGVVYTIIVLLIAVLYAYVIPTSINSHVLFLLVILNALPSLFSFFIQAKYRILMEVDGRKYVITNSETILQLLVNAGKILVLLLTDSLVLIQLVYCVLAIVQLGYLYIYAKRRYKWLNLKTRPDYNAISQKKSVLVHQLSGMVFNNTDIILLSILCDFKVVSVYTIYNIFFSQMQSFITSIVSGFSFALGQMFQVDREKFNKVYNLYESAYIMATFIIYTLMAVFLLPLIQIYTGGINDANYTNVYLVFLFVLMNLLANGKLPVNHVLEYSGKFEETRSHAITEMVINIVVSVVCIIKWGICGAIFGTITALLYRSIVMIYYSNKKVLGRSMFSTYKLWLINGAVFAVVMLILFVDSFSGVS